MGRFRLKLSRVLRRITDLAILAPIVAAVLFFALLPFVNDEALIVRTAAGLIAVFVGVPFAVLLLHRGQRIAQTEQDKLVLRFAQLGLAEARILDIALSLADGAVERREHALQPGLDDTSFAAVESDYIKAIGDSMGPSQLRLARDRLSHFYSGWNQNLRIDRERQGDSEEPPLWNTHEGEEYGWAARTLQQASQDELSVVWAELSVAWNAFAAYVPDADPYPGIARANRSAQMRRETSQDGE